MNKINIVVAGVGGQGVLFASKIIAYALANKMNVIMSEVHGMAQRGGTVVCMIRGGSIHTPLISDGKADMILSLEPVETLRTIGKASENTHIITDITPIIPFTVSIGGEKYPPINSLISNMKQFTKKLWAIDAYELADQAGTSIAANIVMIGALTASDLFPIEKEDMKDIIKRSVPKEFAEIDLKAFDLGYKAAMNEYKLEQKEKS